MAHQPQLVPYRLGNQRTVESDEMVVDEANENFKNFQEKHGDTVENQSLNDEEMECSNGLTNSGHGSLTVKS